MKATECSFKARHYDLKKWQVGQLRHGTCHRQAGRHHVGLGVMGFPEGQCRQALRKHRVSADVVADTPHSLGLADEHTGPRSRLCRLSLWQLLPPSKGEMPENWLPAAGPSSPGETELKGSHGLCSSSCAPNRDPFFHMKLFAGSSFRNSLYEKRNLDFCTLFHYI